MDASAEKELIRSYLLNELPEEEVDMLEERLISDSLFFDQMLAEEEEMIDAYVSGEMASPERKKFEGSYLSTPEGREQVNLAASLLEYNESGRAKKNNSESNDRDPYGSFFPRGFSSTLARIAAVVTLCALPFGVWRAFFYESDVDAGMAALNQAYSQRRPIKARLTGLEHSPPISTRGERDRIDSLALSRAENRLRSAVSADPGAESHHALGRLYLMKGDFTGAIDQLRLALAEDEDNPKIHNDLGAALLEKAKDSSRSGGAGREEALLESLEHLNRAIEIDGSFAEAFFNRGLLHEEMGDKDLAIADWNRYLALDPSSGWSVEVRDSIESLER